jgi:hypothetical protein
VSAFQRVAATNARGVRIHRTPAPKTVTLKADDFASTWLYRPEDSVEIGIRVPPEKDFEGAAIEARRSVDAMSVPDSERAAAVQRAYTRIVVARAICDPEDVTAPHPTVPLPDDQIARAFPTWTIERLFDELDKLHVEQSPAYSAATDEEINRLVEMLSLDDPMAHLGGERQARVRRFLGFVLCELESDD